MDSNVSKSLSKIKRGATLILKNNQKVLFIKYHGLMITVLGENGLKNISYHQLNIDKLVDMYCSHLCYAS